MPISTSTYRLVLKESWTAAGQRRWWEICECNVNGAVRRIIARTPVVLGSDEAADARHAEAREEARRMLSAFEGSAS